MSKTWRKHPEGRAERRELLHKLEDPTPSTVPSRDGYLTVYIDEEYGYRYWVWYFQGTEAELLAWWRDVPNKPYAHDLLFYPHRTFPQCERGGELSPLDDMPVAPEYSMHLHWEDDSALYIRGTCYPYPFSGEE